MEIEEILKLVTVVLSLITIVSAWQKLPTNKTKCIYSIMQILFLLPMVLNFDETATDTWARHIIFYIGQILLFFFLDDLLQIYNKNYDSVGKNTPAFTVIPFAIGTTSPVQKWFHYLTEQGLEHFLPVPLLFLTLTIIRVRYPQVTNTAIKHALNFTIAAAVSITLIHVGEFVVESQHWIPVLEGEVFEILEHGLFLVGLLFFLAGLLKLPNFAVPPHEDKKI